LRPGGAIVYVAARLAKIAVIAGDGIGREVIPEGVRLLELLAAKRKLPIEIEHWPYGADHFLKTGETLPVARMDALRKGAYRAVLLGAMGDPRVPDGKHAREILLGMRFQLDLYVNLRPVRLLDDRITPLKGKTRKDIQFDVFRENTEGLYVDAGRFERRGTPEETAVNEDVNTYRGVTRILKAALEHARKTGKKRVCMSDKSNAVRFAGDLWQRRWKALGADYPELERRHLYIDALAMELVRAPESFDVIVTGNLFGDIITDLAAAITGGLGLAPSANLNPETGLGLFEPVHGSAPDIAGQGLANPLATFLTCALLLAHLGHAAEARMVEQAVEKVVAGGRVTRDLGGSANTREVADLTLAEAERLCQA
jgi:3-isopropylmalate dehydrogenase